MHLHNHSNITNQISDQTYQIASLEETFVPFVRPVRQMHAALLSLFPV